MHPDLHGPGIEIFLFQIHGEQIHSPAIFERQDWKNNRFNHFIDGFLRLTDTKKQEIKTSFIFGFVK